MIPEKLLFTSKATVTEFTVLTFIRALFALTKPFTTISVHSRSFAYIEVVEIKDPCRVNASVPVAGSQLLENIHIAELHVIVFIHVIIKSKAHPHLLHRFRLLLRITFRCNTHHKQSDQPKSIFK